ncbi:solute carrier family 31, member 2, isoform CRA_b [Mus musculus]|nr:solute carrier family 31, member 2, isoform CRA_b [Mus musculus]
MPMHFIFSDEAVLLFDFWRVHSPTGGFCVTLASP